MYGAIDEVGKFAATFKDYLPRSIPPSFSAYTIMEDTLEQIKAERARAITSSVSIEMKTLLLNYSSSTSPLSIREFGGWDEGRKAGITDFPYILY